MSRLRLWLWVSGSLLFAAGIAAGALAGRWTGAERLEPVAHGQRLPEVSSYWLLRSHEVWDQIGLDQEQRSRLEEILAEHYRRDLELRQKLESLADGAQSRIVALLTAEQEEKFSELGRRYSESRIELEAVKELALLRRDIGLTLEQEPEAYFALYESGLEQRDLFRSLRERRRPGGEPFDREGFRAEIEGVYERLFERLSRVLSPAQLEQYRGIVAERKAWFERHRRHRPPPPPGGPPRPGEEGRRGRHGEGRGPPPPAAGRSPGALDPGPGPGR